MESKNANQIPIREILEQYNSFPKREYNSYDMYCSPLREDGNASFQVDKTTNTWKDHGSGEFGSAVDLVMKLEKCSFFEAMQLFEDKNFNTNPITKKRHEEAHVLPTHSSLEILKIAPLKNSALLSYLKLRGIEPDIAQKYCKEIYYRFNQNSKNNFAIAFENNQGGMEFRNPYMKGCAINKGITSIDNGCNRCVVFEGFMDFLSFLQLMKDKPENHKLNFVILNSVAIVNKATSFIKKHEYVSSFLDNDKAGISAYNIISKLGPKTVNESLRLFPDKKDLNEYWTHKLNKRTGQKENTEPPEKKKGLRL